MKVRALIVEDEPAARAHLRDLLAETDWVECVGEASDGRAALEAIDELRPDLIFLDVRLPELNGLEVLERATHRPTVIFTTAYDAYAATAFELEALDYLVKPFGRERLQNALKRVQTLLEPDGTEAWLDRARSALSGVGALSRIFVRDRGRMVALAVSDITRLEAEGDYVGLHAQGRRYLVAVPLSAIEQRLDPSCFLRVHRSHVVNMEHIKQLFPFDAHRLQIEMRDGTKILASRAGSRMLRGAVL
jgi:two-component system LytT family response regulator